MPQRRYGMVLAVLGVALLAGGCAAGTGPEAAGPPSASPAAAAHPSQQGSAGPTPSAAASMVCGEEIRARIAQILALPAAPVPASAWVHGVYTCTYRLPGGTLVLSVAEFPDPATARSGAGAAAAALPGAAPIEGLASLGLPGYRSPGAVVFAKDSFTLTVDATGMGEPIGPDRISRGALAYQVATDVLACWSE